MKTILWDFDGVILDSMPIRDYGFEQIFDKYPKSLVEKFIRYHRINGGLSRFHKIKYFYNEFLKQNISEKDILEYAENFTYIMKQELTNKKYLIRDSVIFIKENHHKYNFHIVSGSEHNELNFLCKKLGLFEYFSSINGSPTPKIELVRNIIESKRYHQNDVILIGDSINDYEASIANNICFYGYNNTELITSSVVYIENFREFKFE